MKLSSSNNHASSALSLSFFKFDRFKLLIILCYCFIFHSSNYEIFAQAQELQETVLTATLSPEELDAMLEEEQNNIDQISSQLFVSSNNTANATATSAAGMNYTNATAAPAASLNYTNATGIVDASMNYTNATTPEPIMNDTNTTEILGEATADLMVLNQDLDDEDDGDDEEEDVEEPSEEEVFEPSTPTLQTPYLCDGPRTVDELRVELFANSEYQKNTRPNVAAAANSSVTKLIPGNAPPDIVQVQMHLLSVKQVDQKRSEFQVMLWFRERWIDHRLKYKSDAEDGCFPDDGRQGFNEADINLIWKPDIIANNMVTKPTEIAGSFWIYPNGTVAYARSQLLTMSCKMDFKEFPVDSQTCDIVIGTWKEDATEVTLKFYDDGRDPVTIAKQEDVGNSLSGSTEWTIVGTAGVEDPSFAEGSTQKESSVIFQITMKRVSEYYIDFVIVPLCLIVGLSYSSFYISRGAAPARIALSIICFLTNMNFLSSQLNSLPRLSNDVWLLQLMTISLSFTFYSVVEYVLCNYLMRIQARINKHTPKAKQAAKKRMKGGETLPLIQSFQLPPLIGDQSGRMSPPPPPPGLPGMSPPSSPLRPPPPPPQVAAMQKRQLLQQQQQQQEEDNDIKVLKADYIASGFSCKVGRLLLKSNGDMIITDEAVEIFSRYGYPIAWGASVLGLYLYYWGGL